MDPHDQRAEVPADRHHGRLAGGGRQLPVAVAAVLAVVHFRRHWDQVGLGARLWSATAPSLTPCWLFMSEASWGVPCGTAPEAAGVVPAGAELGRAGDPQPQRVEVRVGRSGLVRWSL